LRLILSLYFGILISKEIISNRNKR
jgi:hypothetical protein